MSEKTDPKEEPEVAESTTKQKIMAAIANTAVTAAITVAAGVTTNILTKKVSELITPEKKN